MPIIIEEVGDPGSTVTLCRVFFNAADNPVDMAAFDKAGETFNLTTTAAVEVRRLMNRSRAIRNGAGGPVEAMSVKLEHCTIVEVAWLRAHVGVLLCVRDHVGTKFFAIYREVPREVATGWRDRTDVSLSLEQVTHSEAV